MTKAEQQCLALCRSKQLSGMPCMRDVPSNPMPDFWTRNPTLRRGVDRVMVVDNNRWNSPVVAAGVDWDEVLPKLKALVKP